MRTTIDLDEDVLAAAKELARNQRISMSKIVSGLLREALSSRHSRMAAHGGPPAKAGGFRPFPAHGRVVTDALIEYIRDIEGV